MIAAPIWLVTGAKAVWKFLTGLPWWIYLAAVVLVVGWWQLDAYGDRQFAAGQAECQGRWDQAVAAQAAETARRQRAADDAAVAAARAATAAVTETREETHEAVERIRIEWRERLVLVPAECRAAVELPAGVQAEGREAVERARGALRAAQDGRDR